MPPQCWILVVTYFRASTPLNYGHILPFFFFIIRTPPIPYSKFLCQFFHRPLSTHPRTHLSNNIFSVGMYVWWIVIFIDFSVSAACLPRFLTRKRVVKVAVLSEPSLNNPFWIKKWFQAVLRTVLAYFLVSKVIFCSRYSVENIYQGLENIWMTAKKTHPPSASVPEFLCMLPPPVSTGITLLNPDKRMMDYPLDP